MLYIAETNGDGEIEWVWLLRETDRTARPFDAAKHTFCTDQAADFWGAKPMAMMSWMAARQHGLFGSK